jgi:hypothetical protein
MKRLIYTALPVPVAGLFLLILLMFSGFILSAQSFSTERVRPSDESASRLTRNLYQNLSAMTGKTIMIGHQDALAYGIGWKGDDDRSDVKALCGSHPAVVGWDIGGIEMGMSENLDSVPFELIRQRIMENYSRGGVNTISWHAFNPVTGAGSWADTRIPDPVVPLLLPGGQHHDKLILSLDRVAAFLSSLKNSSGELIPIVFRPWHEHTGNWFWWGSIHCSKNEYIELYRFTIQYLRNKHHLNNLLIAFSPDVGFTSPAEYFDRYPGDDVVDVIGLDDYQSLRTNQPEKLVRNLEIITGIARTKYKIAAFTETGCTNVADHRFFTEKLLPCLLHSDLTSSVSWVLFWRNYKQDHHFLPYPGHGSAADFVEFINNERIALLRDIPDLYTDTAGS